MAIKSSEIELLSNRYSKAIFLAAKSNGKLEKVSNDLENLSNSIESSDQLLKLLKSGALSREKMTSLFEEICNKSGVDEITKNFIKVVIDNKRGAIIPQINKKLIDLSLADKNTIKAEITSAKSISNEQIEKIKQSVSKLTGKQIIADAKIDEKIIGGLKVKVGSTLFDDSVATKLNNLNKNLMAN